jgi:hypothetical protein
MALLASTHDYLLLLAGLYIAASTFRVEISCFQILLWERLVDESLVLGGTYLVRQAIYGGRRHYGCLLF